MRAEFRERSAGGHLAVGTRLGKYEILRFIAEGGMGELYVARATGIKGFEKTVALKRILARFASREDHIRMFLDEAKLAATLHHPNIVQVFDIGEESGTLFFTMEYVHGTDCRALLDAAREADQPPPLEVALEIALGVAGGLHHAHEAGIVHRDVSPSNVLLAHDGGVKVTDFGVAKVAERTVETRPGMLKGKVSYMSPEQCGNEPLDRRSDVFAMGILLYELTTLAQPFPGTSDFAIMEQIVRRDPEPPSAKRAGYPAELDAIVMRALQRDRDARFATAQELMRALQEVARDRKLGTSPLAVEGYLRERFGGRVDAWRMAYAQSSLQAAPTAPTVRETPPALPRRVWPMAIPVAMVAAAAITGAIWLHGGTETGVVTSAPALDSVGTPLAPDPGRTAMPNNPVSNAEGARTDSSDGAARGDEVAGAKSNRGEVDSGSRSKRDDADRAASTRGRVDGSKRGTGRGDGHALRAKASAGSSKPVKPTADADPPAEPVKPTAWDPDSPTFPSSK